MNKPKEKAILVDLGNVRIREFDSLNVQIERAEEHFDDKSQQVVVRWRFKGFYPTISAALKAIVEKELLIDEKALKGLKSYLKQIEDSNAKVVAAIESV